MWIARFFLGRTTPLIEQYRCLPGRGDHSDPMGQHAPAVHNLEHGVVAQGILLVGHYLQVAGVADYRVARGARHLPPGVHEASLYLLWIHTLLHHSW